ncbi:MAG: hypothetical protein H0U52_11095 [Chloroflexi bacterium]|nr:hypothetical protein [Chloroflexota bacterium]
MSKGRATGRRRRRPTRADRRWSRWLRPAAAIGLIAAIGIAVIALGSRGTTSVQAAWSRLGTSDVHSLAFDGDDPNHVLFGHHGGISESRDGGGSWQALATTDDAMGMRPAEDGSIVIAGHDVFTASRDGGKTWQPITTDLPSLDIHGFARDPGDPAQMWAALATGGLWASSDFGAHWTQVRQENILSPLAVRAGSTARLLGVEATGLAMSDDGGRTWSGLATPPTYPMTALAATSDGQVVYAGSPEGLYRSADGGKSWSATAYKGSAFAIATSVDGAIVAVVSKETDFFRSPDGGATWPAAN